MNENNTFSGMSIWAVEFGAFFFESTGLVNVETIFTISTVGEILALN